MTPDINLNLDNFIRILGIQNRALDELYPTEVADINSLATLELTRRRAAVGNELLPSVPTDVFIWALGEPPAPWLTKIGGIPYRPRELAWPTDGDGRPHVFLAQFYFGDSRDIVKDIPGDVLLIFSMDSYRDLDERSKQSDLHLEWHSLGIKTLIDAMHIPEPTYGCVTSYGIRHRTVDFQSSIPTETLLGAVAYYSDEIPGPVSFNESNREDWAYFLSRVMATKLGGLPIEAVNRSPNTVPPPAGAQFFGTLTQALPVCNQPFPWMNHPEPITWDESLREQRELVFGPWFVAINFFLTLEGDVFWQFLYPLD